MKLEIITYQEGQVHPPKRTYYAQSHGNNAGRPLRDPIANCFAMIAKNEEQREYYYQMTSALHLAGRFKPYLVGSCVPFIRKHDLRHVIESGAQLIGKSKKPTSKTLKMVTAIEEVIAIKTKQIKQLRDLEFVICWKLFQPEGNKDYLKEMVGILQKF